MLAIFLIIPSLLVMVFAGLFGLLFKAKVVGRVIQSILEGLFIGIALMIGIYIAVPGIVETIGGNYILSMLSIIIVFGLPTAWYYFSHYFTLKAFMHVGKNMDIFIIPFAIVFYGLVIFFVIDKLGYFMSYVMPNFLYVIPFPLAVLYYAVKSLGVRHVAQELKEEEGYPIIGLAVAVGISAIIPFILER